MGSGVKHLEFNRLEQSISNDHNRAQRFLAAHLAEVFRQEFMPGAVYDSNASPPAVIFGGLLVQPLPGSFALNVSSGMIGALGAASTSDDSAFRFGKLDTTASGLSIGANVSGSARWDVVECLISPNTTIEQDNRNVYNPQTELPIPQNVTKVTEGRVQFRVRAGVGGGLPAPVANWIPLAYAHVPNAAASNDGCTFYDVRPMLEDVVGPSEATRRAFTGRMSVTSTGTNNTRFVGAATSVLLGRHIGGVISRCSPGADEVFRIRRDGLGASTATEQSPDVTTAKDLATLYLVFPLGLPRWQRYAAAPGARVPAGPKGLYVFSTISPSVSGYLDAQLLAMPAAYGLGTISCRMVSVFSIMPSRSGLEYNAAFWENDRTLFERDTTLEPAAALSRVVTPDTHHPANARGLICGVQRSWSGLVTGNLIDASAVVFATQNAETPTSGIVKGNDDYVALRVRVPGYIVRLDRDEPLPIVYQADPVTLSTVSSSAYGGTADTPTIVVRGWVV